MIKLETIIESLKPVKIIGNTTAMVEKVSAFDAANASAGTISWLNEKNKEKAYHANAGVIICPDTVDAEKLPAGCTFMLFKSPRKAFQELLLNFFVKKRPDPVISASAVVGKM
jgi:UDP-3-O-[3-hydroxymyristoyl] glucosamine N-acyltransferase